jgi:hypothetical protein
MGGCAVKAPTIVLLIVLALPLLAYAGDRIFRPRYHRPRLEKTYRDECGRTAYRVNASHYRDAGRYTEGRTPAGGEIEVHTKVRPGVWDVTYDDADTRYRHE